MAGEGKRYKDAGYTKPKPLIEVDGKPMILKALDSLPKASKNILVVREDHVVSETFTFKKANLFFEGINTMIKNNDRVNGEFYLDNVFNHLSHKSCVLKVEEYCSWGTPNELNEYLNHD